MNKEKEKKEEYKLVLPDDLVLYWQYSHYEADPSVTEERIVNIDNALFNLLTATAKKLPGLNKRTDAEDAAREYAIKLLNGVCPSDIETESFLLGRFRGYLAKKRNPVQYEMNEILNNALRSLEKDKVIVRDEASRDKRISKSTLFSFSKNTPDEIASRDNYRSNRNSVSQYTTKMRNGTVENSRIITPIDAVSLVQELLTAFGTDCWTRQSDLLWAMQQHVPDQLSFTPMKTNNADGEEVDLDPMDATADQYIYEFTQEQIRRVAWENSQSVWQRICKVNDQVFCLYLLPKNYGADDRKVSLKQFGSTSTINDQVGKMEKILQEEWQDYNNLREKPELKPVFLKIFEFLHGRCTENGYNPGLLQDTDEGKGV